MVPTNSAGGDLKIARNTNGRGMRTPAGEKPDPGES